MRKSLLDLKWIKYNHPYYKYVICEYTYNHDEEKEIEDLLKPRLELAKKTRFTEKQLKAIEDDNDLFSLNPSTPATRYNNWYNNWINAQPEYKEFWKKVNKERKEWYKNEIKKTKTKSFCGDGLNQPGTLIHLDDGSYHLIGTTLPEGTVKSNLMFNDEEIPKDAVVVEYCKLVDSEVLNLLKK